MILQCPPVGRMLRQMFDLTLTFDNGPEPDVTPFVLDVLAERHILSTFFVIGKKLATTRALAERAHAAGHWIGNHTFTHSVPLGLRTEPDIAETEIGQTQILLDTLVHPRKYFRPFGGGGQLNKGLLNTQVVKFLAAGSYSCVLWNSVPRDWENPDGWVDIALEHCTSQPWTVLVLHDLPTGAMRHLPRFLDAIEKRGGRIRQDFAPTCLPMISGKIVSPIEPYVT